MNFPAWLRIAATPILLALFMTIASCAHEDPEAALRTRLSDMQAALSQRKPADFMDAVAADFVGNGGTDRAALHNLLRGQVIANQRIGVTLGPVDVAITGSQATAKFTAVATGGSGGLLPEQAQAYAITSGWRLQDGEWVLYYADWKPAL